MHPDTDQFLRQDAGHGGRVQMGPVKGQLTFERDVPDGWCVLVPAGTWHDITNTGVVAIHVCTIHAPVYHAAGRVHHTAQDAELDEAAGTDMPPAWARRPGDQTH